MKFAFTLFSLGAQQLCAMNPLAGAIGGGGMMSLGRIAQMGPVAYAPNQFSDVSWAMQSMSVLPVPEPEPFVFIDPNLLSEEDACERNYQAACPFGFVAVGEVFGDGLRCAADKAKYTGRCSDRTIRFLKLTVRAKQRWGALCGFQWPCRRCPKNLAEPCPAGWLTGLTKGLDSTVCTAPSSYQGGCKPSQDFALFSPQAKLDWSAECLAYWPCLVL